MENAKIYKVSEIGYPFVINLLSQRCGNCAFVAKIILALFQDLKSYYGRLLNSS